MGLFAKFASVGGATMASRVLGFVREAFIAALLGAGPVADAFYAAFRFPNLFRRLFAEGAFNAAFVPLFAKELEGGGRVAARQFAEQVFSVLFFLLVAITALVMIFMPFLTGTIIAPRFADTPEKFDLTVLLARIMFPYLAAMSLVAMLSGILNSFRRYFLAALAPVLLNIVLIAALIIAYQSGVSDEKIGLYMACGVVISGVLQLALLIVGVRQQGFGFSLGVPRATPAVRRLLVLAAPAALTGGITQINLLIGQIIASAQDGAIATINFADRVFQLPLGVIGIAIGVVLLPELARALKSGDDGAAAGLQNRSLEFGLGLTMPAAVGFIVIPMPIVALLLERGAFTRETTEITSQILSAFALGLPAFVLVKIFTPAFYARENMKTPMWFSLVSVVVNIVGSLLLFPRIGVVGIAIATSLSGWVNVVLLGATLWSQNLFRPSLLTLRRCALIVIASLAMGAALAAATMFIGTGLIDGDLVLRIPLVLGTIAGAGVIYAVIVIATGAIEQKHLRSLVKRKG